MIIPKDNYPVGVYVDLSTSTYSRWINGKISLYEALNEGTIRPARDPMVSDPEPIGIVLAEEGDTDGQ